MNQWCNTTIKNIHGLLGVVQEQCPERENSERSPRMPHHTALSHRILFWEKRNFEEGSEEECNHFERRWIHLKSWWIYTYTTGRGEEEDSCRGSPNPGLPARLDAMLSQRLLMDSIESTLCWGFTLCFPGCNRQGTDMKESNYGLSEKSFQWGCCVRQGSRLTEGVQAVGAGRHGTGGGQGPSLCNSNSDRLKALFW